MNRLKPKPIKQAQLAISFAYSLIMKMEAVCCPEMCVKFCHITWHIIPNGSILHSHHYEKSNLTILKVIYVNLLAIFEEELLICWLLIDS
jgi:hypothetical protein